MVFLPHWPIPYGKKDINLGLDRINQLLDNLGHPEEKLPSVIHVAGTNGKGSTIAYLKAILECAGYKVHSYISPHLVRFNERITLAGEEISDEFLHQIIEQTRIAAGDLQVTFFEGTTAAAFLAFSKIPADFLLLETGLGGRLDATNVIKKPLMSIITPISPDHMEFLGNTIADIALEKAGIIKQNTLCVASWQLEEAFSVLSSKCKALNAPLYANGVHYELEVTEDGFNFIDLINQIIYPLPKPSLIGLHQYLNAAAATAAALHLQQFDIQYEHIAAGLQKAVWPARMQQITQGVLYKMLPAGFELWVDGAHNIGGAQMIAAHIQNQWKDKPTYLINGRTIDRDIKAFLDYFKNIVVSVYAVQIKSEPRSEPAVNIANCARELGFETYECESLTDAVSLIIKNAPVPCRILACGSLYLAGDVLAANKG